MIGHDIHSKSNVKITEFRTPMSGRLVTARATVMALKLRFGRKLLDGVQPAGMAVHNC